MNRRILALLFAVVLYAGLLAAQQAPPQQPAESPPVTFRVEVNYVEVDATVTDAQGSVVTDLSAHDFDVFEDGTPQEVSAFSLVNIPIERAERPLFAARPVEADVQTNENREGRLYLIVLDDLHTDLTRSPRVKALVRRFIERNFGVNDFAAIVFTGRSEHAQDFTNNSRLLLAAVDKFTGQKLRSSTIERLEGARANPETGRFEPGDDIAQMDRAFRARSVMSSIRRLSEFVAGVRGRRKTVLLIGEGVDYDIYEAVGIRGSTASSVLQDTHDAIAAATRGNVSIYAIDPRGLTTGDTDLIGVSGPLLSQGVGVTSLQSELRLSQDSLRALAASTGGFAAVNQNDLNGAFDRVVAENSTYYVLGYYSTNDRRDGRYRTLEVRMKRPGLTVRSRRGYYEARGRRPAQPTQPSSPTSLAPAIAEAIGSPLPMTGVPIKVFATPYKGVAPNAAVALVVEIDVSTLDFIEQGGTFNEQVEVAHTAVDAKGKVFPGDRHTAALTLKPDTYVRTKARGLRVLSQLNLPPGRYQLRVAAGNRTGKAGSVLYDLEVPDFYKLPFVMSGVALTSVAALEVTTITPKDPLGDFLPSPPSTAREFAVGDVLALFAEFYENVKGSPAHSIDLKAELRAEGGRVVRESVEERSSTELGGVGGGYGFTARFPLSDVSPGLYVIHVEGRSRAGDRPSASKDIQIRVR